MYMHAYIDVDQFTSEKENCTNRDTNSGKHCVEM